MELIITRRNGEKHTILYDECDHDIITSRKWCVTCSGRIFYAKTTGRINGKAVFMHRMLLGLSGPKDLADHINGDGLDNRRCNLRRCTHAQNMKNKKSWGNSKYRGVSSYCYTAKNKTYGPYFTASITSDGRLHRLGNFKTEDDAARAYDEAAKKYHGEFSRLNF